MYTLKCENNFAFQWKIDVCMYNGDSLLNVFRSFFLIKNRWFRLATDVLSGLCSVHCNHRSMISWALIGREGALSLYRVLVALRRQHSGKHSKYPPICHDYQSDDEAERIASLTFLFIRPCPQRRIFVLYPEEMAPDWDILSDLMKSYLTQ